MFDYLRKKQPPAASPPVASKSISSTRFMPGTPEADLAAELLCNAPILVSFSPQEAAVLVRHMSMLKFSAGDMLLKEGDHQNTGYLLMILDGEATAETVTVSREAPMTMTVLTPGAILGEMSLMDNAPRSVSCRADSNVLCASLTRASLLQLTEHAPTIAAKLMMMISSRLTLRLRDNTEKLKLYVQLVQAMQGELGITGS
jgi:CRP/FNR family transcriptional regulator, cyclic AMP receptor protein